MSERRSRLRLRRWRPRGLAWSVVLLVALAIAMIVGGPSPQQLSLANPDRSSVSDVRAVLGGLPARPLVLIGMDADLGTYPEIRPAVRAVMADLLAADARIAMVSFTPEGRAIAAAEFDRLTTSGVSAARLLDFGFMAGAEAGLVLAVTDLPHAVDSNNPVARDVIAAGGGIAAFDLVVAVGGIDFGPRGWVEQVATRLPATPLLAVAPTFAHPELAPYLRTGQLSGLLATVRDDAAYAEDVGQRVSSGTASNEPAAPKGQNPTAMLVGMLVALGLIGRAIATRGRPEDEVQADSEDAP